MNVHRHLSLLRSVVLLAALSTFALLVATLAGQNAAPALSVLSREGRRALPLIVQGADEMVPLDELVSIFQLSAREDSGALTVSHKGRTIVLTADQPLASVSGRLVSLSAAPTRVGGRWVLPLDFISRALASIYDVRLDLRRASRLLIVGDLRVPRVMVRHEALGNLARLTIDVTPQANGTVSQERNERLTVRFDADAIDVTLPTFQSQGFIQSLRTLDTTTLAIELGPRYGAYRASTQTIDGTTHMVLEVTGPPGAPAQTQADPAPPELPPLITSTSALNTLAIDAGHGGEDMGARGAGGIAEKEVALAVARRLRAAIESRLGIRVLMTRDDDRVVGPDQRVALANNNKADLFISIHANASFRPTVSGATVYVAAFPESQQEIALAGAERLAAFGGGFRDIELVPWNLAQVRHLARSQQLARILAERLQQRIPVAAKPVDRAPLRVLETANMPAVLVETGYLSHPDQARQLGGADFQNGLVEALVEGIVQFRDALGVSGALR